MVSPWRRRLPWVFFLQHCREQGVHSAIDTAGVSLSQPVRQAVECADLILLLDIKHADKIGFKQLTGGDLQRTLNFLDFAWKLINRCGFARSWCPVLPWKRSRSTSWLILSQNGRQQIIERIELLPFHRMADHKYEKMGWDLPLQNPRG